MKAAVLYGVSDLRVEEREAPEPGKDEMVLKVEVSGLCPSEVRIYRHGSSSVRTPITIGHEFAGRVQRTGTGVQGIDSGDRIAIAADAYCGSCGMCSLGRENLCENPLTFGYNVDGGHADYVLVPQRFIARGGIFHLPDTVDFDEASMTEPLACSLNTIETMGAKAGRTVTVIGDGPMGLMHVGLARVYNADRIVLVGLADWKLRLGQELGATDLVNARDENDPVNAVRDATKGHGSDIVVVTAVTRDTIVQGLKMASRGGRVSIFAGTQKDFGVQIEPNIIHYNELILTGNQGYTYAHYRKAAKMLSSRKIPLKKLITHRFKLQEIHDAIRTWDDKDKSMKIILERG